MKTTTIESQELSCCICEKNWLWTPSHPLRSYQAHQCPDCDAEEELIKLAEKRQELVNSLIEETPPRYQTTSVDHPAFNRKLWETVKGWRPTEERPWLGLIGPAGKCKTRIGFLMLRDIVLESFDQSENNSLWRRSMSFAVAESYSIAKCVVSQYDNDYEVKNPAKAFLSSVRNADLLILDDFGKAKNTPAYIAEMFAILDHRHAHNLPTIWTSNTRPEEIVRGMSEDVSGPLAGRLIECSKIITIK